MVDPVVAWIARLALAAVFAAAAHHKWREPDAFAAALADHELVPEPWVRVLAHGLALAETAVALGLVWPASAGAAAIGAGGLLALYSGAIAVNLWRGRREIDCGCSARPQPLSGALLVRNAALATAVWPAIAPTAQRALVWVDALTAAAGLAALAWLWLAAHALAFGAPARLGRTT
jgi:uncharacterized membrane protein YphA (DoxX/SURF4 family)